LFLSKGGRPQTSTIRLRVPNKEGTLSYTYYPTGKVETIVSSNPNGVKAAYTYDAQNRLATAGGPGAGDEK
jgi:YD repeat-containing protein